MLCYYQGWQFLIVTYNTGYDMFVTTSSCRQQTELKRTDEEVISGIGLNGVQTIMYTARVHY